MGFISTLVPQGCPQSKNLPRCWPQPWHAIANRRKETTMKQIALAFTGNAATLFLAPHAVADPPTQAVQLGGNSYPYCAIKSDRVLCIGGSEWPQKVAFVSASGEFRWGGGSSLGGGQPLPLTPGQTYHWLGWTVVATGTDMTFINDATGHGMTVNNGTANAF
jgi:hypothetical protein